MRLNERLTAIENAVYEIVSDIDYSIIDEDLSDINLQKGKKERGTKLKPPLMAVYFNNADIDNESSSIRNNWSYELFIIGMVVGRDTDKMRKLSTEMTALAMEELLKDRSLKQTVGELRPIGFIPGDERFEIGDNVYASLAQMEVRFTHMVK